MLAFNFGAFFIFIALWVIDVLTQFEISTVFNNKHFIKSLPLIWQLFVLQDICFLPSLVSRADEKNRFI